MKAAAQGCGSSRSAPEVLPLASDDDEALRAAIRCSYTSTDARRRRRKNAALLRQALEESEKLARKKAEATDRAARLAAEQNRAARRMAGYVSSSSDNDSGTTDDDDVPPAADAYMEDNSETARGSGRRGSALPISSLFPFLYFMIRDLHVAKRTEDIGFYAGFVGASFMFGRFLTSTIWGIAADRIGRKPVILFSVFSVVVFNTLFGLSVTYWMAIATRFLLGALNGLLGPIKAYSIEVCRPEHEALALSLVSTSWAIGLIIGPALGGYLALPAEKYPNIFSPDSFFGRFPYFLPCLCTSVFAAVVLISCIWMPETLHKHKAGENGKQSVEALEAHLIDPQEKSEQSGSADTKKSLFKNWPLMSSIIVYCVFSYHDMAYTEVFSLWAESDKKYGGLGLSSEDVGQTLAVTGGSVLVYQMFIYPRINKVLGPIKCCQIAAALCIPVLFAYPYMTYLSGPALSIILSIASVLKNNIAVTIITGLFILQNNAVSQDQRGAANGLAMTGMSLFKAVAPAGAGIMFSWAQKRQHTFFFPGDQMVFFLLNMIELLGLVLTFKPFLAVPEQYDRN